MADTPTQQQPMDAPLPTDAADANQDGVSTGAEGRGGCLPYIPPWVAIAFGAVALLAAGIIISRIGGPLADLILSEAPEIPVPNDVRLLSEQEDTSYARHEWLYTTDQSGCEVARFYLDQGATCRFQPFVCNEAFEQNDLSEVNFFNVATCTRSETDNVTGSSWQVLISSGHREDGRTRFRIYLFE